MTKSETLILSGEERLIVSDLGDSMGAVYPEIKKGDILLGLYLVQNDGIEGGMGRVFKLHHKEWHIDLAMKQPLREFFETKEKKESFLRECEAWIALGLHPHIVNCYYARTIDGVPSVFSEWLDGGSLKERIADKSLYEGTQKEQLERILDLAIQFERGLHYAHECGVIHRDVKPDNLLLTSDHVAKVSDFGVTDSYRQASGETIERTRTYTPAYCSPEQLNGERTTKHTDIWSWAISLMEMLIGDRLWSIGSVAAQGCSEYLNMARVFVPPELKDLIRNCLQEKIEMRPKDFLQVDRTLLRIYEKYIGRAYVDEIPEAVEENPSALNNKALSLWDIGKAEEAFGLWDRALILDPFHSDSFFNRTMFLWRSGKQSMPQTMQEMKTFYERKNRDEHSTWLYVRACMEACDYDTAKKLLKSLEHSSYAEEAEALKNRLGDRAGAPRLLFKAEVKDSSARLCLSPDKKKLFIGSFFGLEVRDKTTFALFKRMVWSENYQRDFFRFASDGAWALLFDETTKELNIRSTQDGAILHQIRIDKNKLWSAYVHEAENRITVFSYDEKKSEFDEDLFDSYLESYNLSGEKIGEVKISSTGDLHRNIFSPDGKYLFFTEEQWQLDGYDSQLLVRERIYTALIDVSTGERLQKFDCVMQSAVFSPDGSQLLTKDEEKEYLFLRNEETSEFIQDKEGIEGETPDGYPNPFYRMPSESRAVFLSAEELFLAGNKVRLMNLLSRQTVYEYPFSDFGTRDLCIDAQKKQIFVMAQNGDVYACAIPLEEFKNCREFSHIEIPEERFFAQERYEELCALIKQQIDAGATEEAFRTIERISEIFGYENRLETLWLKNLAGSCCEKVGVEKLLLKEKYFLSAENTKNCQISSLGNYLYADGRLYDFWSGKCLHTFSSCKADTVFSPKEDVILSGSELFNLRDLTQAPKKLAIRSFAKCRFSPDAKRIYEAAMDEDGRIRIRISEPDTGKTIRGWEDPRLFDPKYRELFYSDGILEISPDEKYLTYFFPHCAEEIIVWDLENGESFFYHSVFPLEIQHLHFTLSGELFIHAQSILLWDIVSGHTIYTRTHDYPEHWDGQKYYFVSALTGDGSKAALYAHPEKELLILDVRSGETICRWTLERLDAELEELCITSDGKFILARCENPGAKILCFDMQTMEPPVQHIGKYQTMVLHPSGNYAAVSDESGLHLLCVEFFYKKTKNFRMSKNYPEK